MVALAVVLGAYLPSTSHAHASTTCAFSAGTNIANCGFESPVLAAGGYIYNPGATSWTFDAGSGIAANSSPFTASQAAPEGVQVAFVQGTGSFTQALTGFTPGQTYTLSFQSARRANIGGPQDISVLIDGSSIGSLLLTSTAYTQFNVAFVASASAHTIGFAGLNSAGGDNTAFIDDVQLSTTAPPTGCTSTAGTTLSQCGFEQPSLGTGAASYTYTAFLGSAWKFSGGAGLAGNGSAFTTSQVAPDGSEVAFLQGAGLVQQSVGGFQSGTNYTLTFSSAQRLSVPSNQDLAILLDGTRLATVTPTGAAYAPYSVSFTTTTGQHTIAFQGLNTAGGDNTAFLDAVALTGAAQPVTGGDGDKQGEDEGSPGQHKGDDRGQGDDKNGPRVTRAPRVVAVRHGDAAPQSAELERTSADAGDG